jgi:hypothetical protein
LDADSSPSSDPALLAKDPLFTPGGWYGISIGLFLLWTFLSFQLRRNSVAQDADGAASHTRKLRFYAAWGIVAFGFTLTMGAILWMKGLEHQWFSTMYGVYYFAGSVWTTLATVYLLTLVLKRSGPLAHVVGRNQFHDIGKLFFAFTVFYAYIHFSQYFIIWNGGMPEETFYYVKREVGSWWGIGMLIVFGHFVIPFLGLLRIDCEGNLACDDSDLCLGLAHAFLRYELQRHAHPPPGGIPIDAGRHRLLAVPGWGALHDLAERLCQKCGLPGEGPSVG